MRLQLALNVRDMDAAVDFYSKMFGVEPSKREPGYANFAIAEPPLKLVLFEAPSAPCRSRRRPRRTGDTSRPASPAGISAPPP